MKKLSLIAVMVLGGLMAFSTLALAQGQAGAGGQGGAVRGRRMDATAQLERYKTELKLDEKQTAGVKAVLEKQTKKMQELRQDTSASQEDRRTKMQALRKETNDEMKKILTADQYKQYEGMQTQRGRRQGGAAGQ